jgi:hypothetical protein
MARSIKNRQRVADHGEVFTPEKTYSPTTISELAAMLDEAPKELG